MRGKEELLFTSTGDTPVELDHPPVNPAREWLRSYSGNFLSTLFLSENIQKRKNQKIK